MKQEEKDLLLKDLCARLPYGVKMQKSNDQNVFVDLYAINLNNYTIDFYTYKGKSLTIANTSKLVRSGILLYKPCLFPRSSMTDEQRNEYESLCIKETSECIDLYGIIFTEDYYYDTVASIDYLYKNHIDIRGLIPMGLAIDATGLNIY